MPFIYFFTIHGSVQSKHSHSQQPFQKTVHLRSLIISSLIFCPCEKKPSPFIAILLLLSLATTFHNFTLFKCPQLPWSREEILIFIHPSPNRLSGQVDAFQMLAGWHFKIYNRTRGPVAGRYFPTPIPLYLQPSHM